MSSSVFEVCGWEEEEDAPDVLVILDENEPISAPIKGRWALCPDAAAADEENRELDSRLTSRDRLF